jgi:hypothetical protein
VVTKGNYDCPENVPPILGLNGLSVLSRLKPFDVKRATISWGKTWGHLDVISTENFPDVEPPFEPHVATSLFRIAQEALSIALKRASVKSTDLTVCVDHGNFSMRFSDDGVPNAELRTEDPAMILASIRRRIRMLGGCVQLFRAEAGATVLTVSMPLPNIVGNYRKIAVRKPSVRPKTLADSSPAGATMVIIRSPCVWRAITKGTTELTAIW